MFFKARYTLYRNNLNKLVKRAKTRTLCKYLQSISEDTRKEYCFISEFLNFPQKKKSGLNLAAFKPPPENFNDFLVNMEKQLLIMFLTYFYFFIFLHSSAFSPVPGIEPRASRVRSEAFTAARPPRIR